MKKSRIGGIGLALLLGGAIIGLSGCFAGPGYYPGPVPYAYHYPGGWGRPGWGGPGWGGRGWGWGDHDGWGEHGWGWHGWGDRD